MNTSTICLRRLSKSAFNSGGLKTATIAVVREFKCAVLFYKANLGKQIKVLKEAEKTEEQMLMKVELPRTVFFRA
jgi:hypothetical protein